MATVKRKQEDDLEVAYVVLHNGMDRLFDEINRFCEGEYGRKCDLYQAYIAKHDPSNYPAKKHEFDGVGADLLDKVKNHLERAHDFIKFEFDSDDGEFAIDIVPASETEYLVDRINKEDMDALQETDTVVMVETTGADVPEAEQFLENL